jgi:prepilin-type N-terminal cleavage/methylation domain-containing protein
VLLRGSVSKQAGRLFSCALIGDAPHPATFQDSYRRPALNVLKKKRFRIVFREQTKKQTRKNELIHTHMIQKLNTKTRGGFTLVEIMIVVAIIGLLVAIAVPNFLRARKRSQATQVLEDLRLLDGAVDQYAIEFNKLPAVAVTWDQVKLYLKTNSRLYSSGGKDMFGNSYGSFTVDQLPKVPTGAWNALSDVAPVDFWSPYSN